MHDEFAGSDVDFATGTIHKASHGLSTGTEVVYSGAHLPLGGLLAGGHYYAIAVDASHFRLAASAADAAAGIAIGISQGQGALSETSVVETVGNIGVPSLSMSEADTSGLANNNEGKAETANRTGVAVVAVSTNSIESAGAAAGGAGIVSVQVAGAVSVHSIDTKAHIDAGARVNADQTGTGAGQSVAVDAGRTYHGLALGLAGAGQGPSPSRRRLRCRS